MTKRNPGIKTAAGNCYSARGIAEYYSEGNEDNKWKEWDPLRIKFQPSDIKKIEKCVEKYVPSRVSRIPENGSEWEANGMISPERYAWLERHIANHTTSQRAEWNRANGL
jgi:hypothetical protein